MNLENNEGEQQIANQHKFEIKQEIGNLQHQNNKFLHAEVVKKIQLEQVELQNPKSWMSIKPQFTGNKELQFIQQRNSYEFWRSKVANSSKNIFISLYPCQIVKGIVSTLNRKMQVLYQNQDERELQKRKFKSEQIYEYYGVKILMGYNRLPDPEDYFNSELPFRNKICELIKEGRYKYIEYNTSFSDEVLLQIKYQGVTKQERVNSFQVPGEVCFYITKKINKRFRLSVNAQQCLVIIKNNLFDSYNLEGEAISCLLLIDIKTQYILSIRFCQSYAICDTILNMLNPYYYKNHKLYFQYELLPLNIVNALAKYFGIYACGLLAKSPESDALQFTSDLITNNTVMLLRLLKNKQGGEYTIFASTADAFCQYSFANKFSTNSYEDKRSYVTVIYQEYIKLAEQYQLISDRYKCLFSTGNLHTDIYNEILEVVYWNSFIATKVILSLNSNINYLDFRLSLAKSFLQAKLKNISNIVNDPASSQLQYLPKFSTVGINTDMTGQCNLEEYAVLPKINFHIPCQCIAPKKLQNKLKCIVCKYQPLQLVDCKTCSEISGKLIVLCPKECFSVFHQDPKRYIDTAEQLPVLKASIQYEQSALSQSENYQKSYMEERAKYY